MQCNVRRANAHDLDSLFVLLEQFTTSFKAERASFERSLSHLLDDDSAWLAVAECDGEIVGYCLGFDHYTLYANGRVSWVEEITVEEGSRRRGIGRALMAAFEVWAQSRGSRLVALATRRAAPFYKALGYEDSAVYFRKMITGSKTLFFFWGCGGGFPPHTPQPPLLSKT